MHQSPRHRGQLPLTWVRMSGLVRIIICLGLRGCRLGLPCRPTRGVLIGSLSLLVTVSVTFVCHRGDSWVPLLFWLLGVVFICMNIGRRLHNMILPNRHSTFSSRIFSISNRYLVSWFARLAAHNKPIPMRLFFRF